MIKKAILILTLVLLPFGVKAQEPQCFPIDDVMVILSEQGKEIKAIGKLEDDNFIVAVADVEGNWILFVANKKTRKACPISSGVGWMSRE